MSLKVQHYILLMINNMMTGMDGICVRALDQITEHSRFQSVCYEVHAWVLCRKLSCCNFTVTYRSEGVSKTLCRPAEPLRPSGTIIETSTVTNLQPFRNSYGDGCLPDSQAGTSKFP